MNTLRLLFFSFSRIWRVLPHRLRKSGTGLFISMVILGLLELGGILSLSLFVGVLNDPERVQQSKYAALILEYAPFLGPVFADSRTLMLCTVLVPISMIVTKNMVSAFVTWKTGLLGGEVAGFVGCEIMRRFVYMPYDWHISSLSAEAFTKMSWRHSLGQLLIQSMVAYSNFITAGLLFLGLFIYAPGLTMLVLGVMAVTAVTLYGAVRKNIDKSSHNNAQAQARESHATMAAVRGIREILIYQQQPTFLHAISQAIRDSVRPRAFLETAPPIPAWVLESMGFVLIGCTLAWMTLIQDASRAAITANIAMLTLTAWRVLPSLNRAVGAIVNIRANQPTGLPCLEYMEQLKAVPQLDVESQDSNFAIKDGIRLDNIYYRYPSAEQDSLKGVTLDIPKGASVGIIGKSGAGKSTLINVLSGLLQPASGRILVDGREMTPGQVLTYRQSIGYVPQNPYLMAGTVAENIAFSQWGRPPDAVRLHEACRQAQIDFLGENFENLSRGIGENGAGLSGGQAQRVTIARALYARPAVLIFDEATSSLDHRTEESIRRTIAELPQGITRVIIAHKLTALKNCDLVYWLEDGKVYRKGDAAAMLESYQTEIGS